MLSAIFPAEEPSGWDAGNTEELTRNQRANKSENSRRGEGSEEGDLGGDKGGETNFCIQKVLCTRGILQFAR